MSEPVKGFKVFNPDWTCRRKQYTCPGTFEEDVIPNVCKRGMHFCEKAANCFNYYPFDPECKVAEVIAYGTVVKDGDKCCTDKLEIVREISWSELLELVNTGKGCSGYGNSGNGNSGDRNSGDRNSGDRNSGDRNSGNGNNGNRNSGDRNSGNGNSGIENSGDGNSGIGNSGDGNSGDGNSGDGNSGIGNSGSWNSGDFNIANGCIGCFNTAERKIDMFNQPTNWTLRDWHLSEAREVIKLLYDSFIQWVYLENMDDEERKEHPESETTGGYMKGLSKKEQMECRKRKWNRLSDEKKRIVLSLPNFDPEIFKQCTGIDGNID